MKVTPHLRKEILRACRDHVGGFGLAVEIGLRGDDPQPNALRWDWDEDDLADRIRLGELKEIDDHDSRPNSVALLDCYCTAGKGEDRELISNCYVFIENGHVIHATTDDLRVNKDVADLFGLIVREGGAA